MPSGGFAIDVLDLGALDRAFQALVPKLQAKVLRPALRAGAKVMRDAAVAGAPRFTGSLAEHIRIRAMARKRGRIGFLVLTGTKRDLGIPERTKGGHPRGYYPIAIEYGWHPRNAPGTKRVTRVRKRGPNAGESYETFRRLTRAEFGTSKVPANPWMSRAFKSAKPAAIQAIRAEVVRRIEDMARSAGFDPSASFNTPETGAA